MTTSEIVVLLVGDSLDSIRWRPVSLLFFVGVIVWIRYWDDQWDGSESYCCFSNIVNWRWYIKDRRHFRLFLGAGLDIVTTRQRQWHYYNVFLEWGQVLGDPLDSHFFLMNIWLAPDLETSPERFSMASIAIFSASEQTHCVLVVCDSEWVTVAEVVYLQRCLVVTQLVPRETAAVSAHVVCTPYSHAPRSYSKSHMQGACVFNCNLPPAFLAKWPGSFACYCGNTVMELIPK